jgi:GT2 family glycosyltransferase
LSAKIQISASIVLYNENIQVLEEAITSFLKVPLLKKLYLIDNSPKRIIIDIFKEEEIEYIFVGKNVGFGAAHNLVINKIKSFSKFHLILNPDVSFKPSVVVNLSRELENNPQVSLISPRVLYPNGSTQVICRKTPFFKEMLGRRLGVFNNYVASKQYQKVSEPFFPDFIHGCFMLFKTDDFISIKGFDERYFLYMEDADICRKIKESGKEVLYYPKEQITHIHRKGSAKKGKLLYYHLVSAIKYFKKWHK